LGKLETRAPIGFGAAAAFAAMEPLVDPEEVDGESFGILARECRVVVGGRPDDEVMPLCGRPRRYLPFSKVLLSCLGAGCSVVAVFGLALRTTGGGIGSVRPGGLIQAYHGSSFVHHPGYNCWAGKGGEELPMQEQTAGLLSLNDCVGKCSGEADCEGIIVPHGIDCGVCLLRRDLVPSKCAQGTTFDLWEKPKMTTTTPEPLKVLTFTRHSALSCAAGSGGVELAETGSFRGDLSYDQCKVACENEQECAGFAVSRHDHKRGCHVHQRVLLSNCQPASDWDTWFNLDNALGPFESAKDIYPWYFEKTTKDPESIVSGDYFSLEGYNCWAQASSAPLQGYEDAIASTDVCEKACQGEPMCSGFIVGAEVNAGQCWLRQNVMLPLCEQAPSGQPADWDFWLRRRQDDGGAQAKSPAPSHEFYMYRATADDMMKKYPFGEENTANMDGVLWYLANEIVTNYSHGLRCPRRFGITRIHRFKVRTTATPELFAEGMNFGIRYAYDEGKCNGRCFPGNRCTGEGDCATHYDKYGYFVGCNRFVDQYPFPQGYIAAPSGVWYSLPLGGRCSGNVTGQKDCTWSYEPAGELSLKEIEDAFPGKDNCCEGHCTDFWRDQYNVELMSWRVREAVGLFAKKFPEQQPNLPDPPCDFNWRKWYTGDPWPARDPWGKE